MDDLVRQAMAKWPHVPACYGWLGLDARGQWCMRDDRVQALGSFQSGLPGAKGSVLRHDKLIDFIGRNYEADAQGRWYFQNGPQRVYVELEVAPWVWRIQPDGQLCTHTGRATEVQACWQDEAGRVLISSPLGLGLVHSQDVGAFAEAMQSHGWAVQPTNLAALWRRHGVVVSPQAEQDPV